MVGIAVDRRQIKLRLGNPRQTVEPLVVPLLRKVLGITLLELLDSTCGVDELLLAGEERVAGGADLNFNLVQYGTELELGATGTGCRNLFIIRMNVGFHNSLVLQHTVNVRFYLRYLTRK